MSVASIERRPWPAGVPYTVSPQKLRGAKRKERWARMSEGKRDELRRALSIWRVVGASVRGADAYRANLDGLGLTQILLEREGNQDAGPMGLREHAFLAYVVAAACVLGRGWLYVERRGLAMLLRCSERTAARVMATAVARGLVEPEHTFGQNARLDAYAARGEAFSGAPMDWECGACYRPTALLRTLYEQALHRARTRGSVPWDRAPDINLPCQDGQATPGSGSQGSYVDPDLDTPMPGWPDSGGKEKATDQLCGGVMAPPSAAMQAFGQLVARISEAWKGKIVNPTRPPPAPPPPALPQRENGHTIRCTCEECWTLLYPGEA